MLPCLRSFAVGMRAASIGVRVSAMTRERSTALATVAPNSLRKLPTMPRAKTTGTKTAAIETVAAVAAKATCLAPLEAASLGLSPCSRCRSMFSRTTIASSITTPTARVIARSVMVLSVKSKIHITPKVVISENGIEIPTISVGRQRRRKPKTVKVARTAPNWRAKSVSWMDSRMASEKSASPSPSLKRIPPGRIACILEIRARTSSVTATVLPPDCFWMPTPSAVRPS